MRITLFTLALVQVLSLESFVGLSSVAMAEGIASDGKKVFRRCAACHAVGEGAKNKVGPQLNGIVGRSTGSISDFKYSEGLAKLAEVDHVWTADTMAAYIVAPADYIEEVAGEKLRASMAPQRLKEQQIADVIAYLGTFDADGAESQ